MCFGGGPSAPKPVATPVSATSTAKFADIESRARKGFASTILGQTSVGAQSGADGRYGELKTVLGQ